MLRAVSLAAVVVALSIATGLAQPRAGLDRDCPDGWRGDRGRGTYCTTREQTLPATDPVDIDAARNGGISIRGSDRSDVRLTARITARADADDRAQRLADDVRIETGARIRATGPATSRDEHWSVSFEAEVPRRARIALHTVNGGISIENFAGAATFRATNGGVSFTDVGGDIRGTTTNGGVTVRLSGDRWDGAGLDVETRNGGVRMSVPDGYSAELETGTVNGRVRIDFPVMVRGSIGRDIRTTLGSGGARIRAMTRNGGVTIERR